MKVKNKEYKGFVQILGPYSERHIAKYHRRVVAILFEQLGIKAEQSIRKYEGGLGNEYLWQISIDEDAPRKDD